MLHFEHLREHKTTWILCKFAPRNTKQANCSFCGWMQQV